MSRPVVRSFRVVPAPAWLLGLVFGVVACAGAVYVAEDAPPPAEIQSVLLVAMNFEMTPPARLRRGLPVLQEQVREYLASTGREVRQARMYEVVRHWKPLAETADGFTTEDGEIDEVAYEQARAKLAQRLAEVHRVDAIAMPTLLVRDGYYSGTNLRWDGVSRPVPIEEEAGSFMTTHEIAGKGRGTSLRMSLYAPDGTKFFERHAGLEPLLEWSMGGFGSARGARVQGQPRRDLFRDPQIVEESVALSFSPLIPPPEESSE